MDREYSKYQRLHLRVFNAIARVFGIWAGLIGLGFLLWASGVLDGPYRHHSSTDERLMWLGAGVFCELLAVAFVSVKAYRPDLPAESRKARASWWTGEPSA